MNEAVIVSAVRTAVGKAPRGALRSVRPEDMLATTLRAVVDNVALTPDRIDDVAIGCAFPEAEQGLNVGRIATLRAGFPESVSAQTLNRQCASGLQTIAIAAQQIMTGMGDVIIAGGVESLSRVPMTSQRVMANPGLMEQHPGTYLNMGLTAENLARRYAISRAEQDRFALRSHERAAAATRTGRFRNQIVPLEVCVRTGVGATVTERSYRFEADEGIRYDTTFEQLSALQPVFHAQGTVTAGNSSQTSDGAAAVLLMNGDLARAEGLTPLARFRSFAVAGVPPDIMGIGPIAAIPQALHYAGMTLEDIDLIELNEAFAVQALAVMQELDLDTETTNVNGGAVALGHPLGATGAKLTVQMIHELPASDGAIGLVTMCVGGGMGAAGIFERLH